MWTKKSTNKWLLSIINGAWIPKFIQILFKFPHWINVRFHDHDLTSLVSPFAKAKRLKYSSNWNFFLPTYFTGPLSDYRSSLRHPNHFVLAGANNRNVIIIYRFLTAPVRVACVQTSPISFARRQLFEQIESFSSILTVYLNCKYCP